MSNAVIGALRVIFGADTVAFEKGVDEVERKISRAQKDLGKLGDQFTSAGKKLSLGLTAPVTAFGVLTFRTAADFQTAMNQVAAVSGATGDELQKLRDQARELGATTQYSASNAAEAMGFLAMAGMKTNDILGAMPGTLQLAASAQLDMSKAADIVTNILAGYNMEVDQLGRANDVLVKSFTSANTDLVQLAEAMKYAGPVAQAAGVEFEQAAASLSLMGNAGIQGSMAGTSLRGAISRVLNPTKAMSAAMDRAGLKFTDAKDRLLPLDQIIQQLEPHADDAGLFMMLFGQRAGPAMSALVGQGADAVRNLTHELRNSGGTAEHIAKVQMQGANGAMQELKSVFEELTLSIAESGFLEAVTGVIRKLTEFVGQLSRTSPEVLRVAAVVATLAAAIGPALIAVGLLIKGFSGALPVLAKLTGATALAGIGPLLLPLAGLVAGVVIAWKNWEKIGPWIEGVASRTSKAVSAVDDFLSKLNEKIDETDRALGTGTKAELFEGWAKSASDAWTKINSYDLAALAARVDEQILAAFASFDQFWQRVQAGFNDLRDRAVAAMQAMFNGVKTWIVDRLGGLVKPVVDTVGRMVKPFRDAYIAVVGNSYIPDMVTEIGQHMRRLDDEMVKPAKSAAAATAEAFRQLQQDAQSIFARLFPEQARDNAFARDLKTIEDYARQAKWSVEQLDEARARLFREYGGQIERDASNDPVKKMLGDFDVGVLTDGIPTVSETVKAEWEKTQAANDNLRASFADLARDIAGSLGNLVNDIKSGDWLGALQSVLDVVGQVAGILGGTAQPATRTFSTNFGGFRADGGTVRPGNFYITGERGPEAFVPRSAGTIIPNHKLGTRQQPSSGIAQIVPSPYFDVVVDGRVVSTGAPMIAQSHGAVAKTTALRKRMSLNK